VTGRSARLFSGRNLNFNQDQGLSQIRRISPGAGVTVASGGSSSNSGIDLVIDLAQYLERRRRTAETRVMQLAAVSRDARRSMVRLATARASRWSGFLPLLPALELAGLYAEASLV
jgi:hypothetical protein